MKIIINGFPKKVVEESNLTLKEAGFGKGKRGHGKGNRGGRGNGEGRGGNEDVSTGEA